MPQSGAPRGEKEMHLSQDHRLPSVGLQTEVQMRQSYSEQIVHFLFHLITFHNIFTMFCSYLYFSFTDLLKGVKLLSLSYQNIMAEIMNI